MKTVIGISGSLRISSVDGPTLVLVGKTSGTTSADMAVGQMSGTTSGTQQVTSTAQGPAQAVATDIVTDMSMAMGTSTVPITIKGSSKMTVVRLP